jgi:hypothetical protein
LYAVLARHYGVLLTQILGRQRQTKVGILPGCTSLTTCARTAQLKQIRE